MIYGNSFTRKPVLPATRRGRGSGIEGLACIVLVYIIFIAGCEETISDIKNQYRPDDEKKSCKKLQTEITIVEKAIAEKQREVEDYEEELFKYRELDTRLKVICASKNCSTAAAVEKEEEQREEK
jgi:uncharacterized protein YlxW (UPF0749 family)